MVGKILELMAESMDVLEDNKRIIENKVIPVGILGVTCFIRFMCFYEIKGITTQNGWGGTNAFCMDICTCSCIVSYSDMSY